MLTPAGRLAIGTLALAVVVALGSPWWLPEIAHFLILESRPEPAEIIVVLAGDGTGNRLLRAAELVEQGYAPLILIDGPIAFYGQSEADLALRFMLRRGYPRGLFEPFPMRAFSTFEESQIVDRELRRRGIRKAIVVTSEFHTRRSRHIFLRHGSGEVEYIFAPSRTIGFDPDHWWQSRMGKKVVVQEWMKTLNSWWE